MIEPASLEALRSACVGRTIRSYWGHDNTLVAASTLLGVDLTPDAERPALVCNDATGLPALGGELFAECWVLSPELQPGFRPLPGAIVALEQIVGWQSLRLKWEIAS